jgi:threonine dehydrogenase-like Zn-dependent dehydrogenase
MKLLEFQGARRLQLLEMPLPTPQPHEVVVRTLISAICGSEMHAYRGNGSPGGNPGHEACGIVHAVGDHVRGLRPGQRVGVSAVGGCGRGDCPYCQRGQSTWCPRLKIHVNMHAEYFVAAESCCLPLPDDIPPEAAVLLAGDGLGVPYHTSRRLLSPEIRNIVVFGLGPVGLGHTLVQSHLGRAVIGVDISPYRLEYALRLGAVRVVDARAEDAVKSVRQIAEGGADVCIEAAGRPETLRQCFAAVRPGGTVVMSGEQPQVQLSPSEDFIRRDITAMGCWFYQVGEFPDMLRLYRDGLDVRRLVSHVLPLEEAAEAYRLFDAGLSAKVLLRMQA